MGIVYKLEKFEGPLDLLLHLIEKNRVDIYDIPIVEITEQYLAYVKELEKENLDVISDFLVMAATLLEIKARMLLPAEEKPEEGDEEADPREELVRRLIEYRAVKAISAMLSDMRQEAGEVVTKPATIPKEVAGFVEPPDLDVIFDGVTMERMRQVMEMLLRRREEKTDPVRSRFGVIKKEPVSLKKRIGEIIARVRLDDHLSFSAILSGKNGRTETVVAFLAVLELMKAGVLLVTEVTADDIMFEANVSNIPEEIELTSEG